MLSSTRFRKFVPHGLLLLAALGASQRVFADVAPDTVSDLAAYYCFESSAVTDCSGRRNDGEAIGDVTLAPGRVGTGARFGGFESLGYVHVPNSNSLSTKRSFTIAYWIKLDTFVGEDAFHRLVANGTHVAVAKSHDQSGFFTLLNTPTGPDSQGAAAGIDYGQGIFVQKNFDLALGQWNHVAYTVSTQTKTIRLYINGQLSKIQKLDNFDLTTFSGEDLYLGAQSPRVGNNVFQYPMAGMLDEVRFYRRALTAADVAALVGPAACEATPAR